MAEEMGAEALAKKREELEKELEASDSAKALELHEPSQSRGQRVQTVVARR